jgi:NodT family efflux transporter outer membrane factor (OMF) lipoprotein
MHMHHPAILSALGLPLLLCGCTVGPNYRAPSIPIEESFPVAATQPTTRPNDGTTAVTTSPITAARWWQTLNDPQLDSLMQEAVTSNLDVKIAAARVQQARAELAYAAGGQYPTVNLNAAYSHNRLSQTAAPYNAFNVPGFPWEYNQYQAGFDASWELDLFGGLRRGVEAARADLAANDADRQNVLLSVMAEVARNYVDLRGAQRRFDIAQNNLRAQRETLEVTQDRRKQGIVTELDVAQAQSQVSKTEAELPLLQRQQAEAIHRIALLLGQQPEALTDQLSKPTPVPVPPPEIAIGVPAELLRRRPDIRRAERELAAATARIGVATADLFPRLSLTGNFATVSAGTQDLFDWRSMTYGVGPTVTWPIFDAGRLRRLVDVRTAQQAQALAQYERTVLGALEEVHNALVTFVTEQQRHRALASAVAADRTAADVARAQYRQGIVDFLHVLDAQRSLFESEDRLADSDRAVTTALVALYKALAGGWKPVAPPPPPQEARAQTTQVTHP